MNEKKAALYNLEYRIKMTPDMNSTHPFSLKETIDVLERRMEVAGYDYDIKTTDDQTIRVSLRGISDTLSPYHLLTANGKVQFTELYNISELSVLLTGAIEEMNKMNPQPVIKTPVKRDSMSKEVRNLLDSMESSGQDRDPDSPDLINFNQPYKNESGGIVFPAAIGTVKVKDTATVRELFASEKLKHVAPPGMQLCFEEKKLTGLPGKEDPLLSLYFIKKKGLGGKPVLGNEDVLDARQDFDQSGKTEIRLEFNQVGTRKWKEMTEQNIGRPIAIIVNGYVVCAPTVLSAIPGGLATISGSYTIQEAADLANSIKSGKLPCTLSIISTSVKKAPADREINKPFMYGLVSFLGFTVLFFFVLNALKPIKKAVR
jgi:preprotein translocase subunit SecD